MNGKGAEKHGECLRDEVLTDYLEGTLDTIVKGACEAHLIACDPCRENLALFMKVLRDEVEPEEDEAVQQLSALWDQRNPRPVPQRSRLPTSYRRWIYAAVAALVVAAVLISRMPFGSELSPTAQIVKAMASKERPFEPRIVDQPYLTMQEFTRSPEDIEVSDLLEAEMTEKSATSYEVGRYFLLRRKYPMAIKYLRTAVADPRGVPADVHNDLGVAYLESRGDENLAAAEGEFKEALSINPNHLPAMFNLSVLYGRNGRADEANRRRQQYLALDPDSDWAREVKQKLLGKESAEP